MREAQAKMKKILLGVFSDTHNNITDLRRLAASAKNSGATAFIHLGDTYRDAEALFEYSTEIYRVPGLYEKEYRNPGIPNRFFKEIYGFKLFLTHSDRREEEDLSEDADPQKIAVENLADIYLYGHSHLYEARIKGDTLFLNPGSLKAGDTRAALNTYGLLEIFPKEKKAVGRVLDLKGNILTEALLLKL